MQRILIQVYSTLHCHHLPAGTWAWAPSTSNTLASSACHMGSWIWSTKTLLVDTTMESRSNCCHQTNQCWSINNWACWHCWCTNQRSNNWIIACCANQCWINWTTTMESRSHCCHQTTSACSQVSNMATTFYLSTAISGLTMPRRATRSVLALSLQSCVSITIYKYVSMDRSFESFLFDLCYDDFPKMYDSHQLPGQHPIFKKECLRSHPSFSSMVCLSCAWLLKFKALFQQFLETSHHPSYYAILTDSKGEKSWPMEHHKVNPMAQLLCFSPGDLQSRGRCHMWIHGTQEDALWSHPGQRSQKKRPLKFDEVLLIWLSLRLRHNIV